MARCIECGVSIEYDEVNEVWVDIHGAPHTPETWDDILADD